MKKIMMIVTGLVALGLGQITSQTPELRSTPPKFIVVETFAGPTIPRPWVLVGVQQNRVDASPAQLYLFNPVTGQTAVWLIQLR